MFNRHTKTPCTAHFYRASFTYPMSKATNNTRLKKAQEIASNPSAYKVCEACDSIVGLGSTTCPNCHGYRFDTSDTRVVDQAIFLGTRKKTSVTASDLV